MKQAKKTGQQGKKEVGEAGREDSIKGEEDRKWKPMDGEKETVSSGSRGGTGQGD